MSRIGKEPVALPKEVKIKIENNSIFVEKGDSKLDLAIPEGIKIEITEGLVAVKRENDLRHTRCLHGTIRVLVQNMIKGVTEGYKKDLEIVGVGYKAQVKDKTLVLNVGFSHTVDMIVPQGLKVTTPAATKISIEGIDKQKVGEFAAVIRRVNPPEPYKGKGIRYAGEEVRKKLGKALAK